MSRTPKVPLLDCQKAYVEDESQFVAWVASRQTGKSHGIAVKDVRECIKRPVTNVILSAGKRQSLEVGEKVKMICQALGAAAEALEDYFEDTLIRQETIKFPNGGRIILLPANPATARGYSGNVTLDEFALHKDATQIWRALFPTTTRGYKLRVTSTFFGTENKFYQICRELGLTDGIAPAKQPVTNAVWSGHWTDIHMAAEQAKKALGLAIDVEKLRAGLGDEEAWQQEYCNIPLSDAENYIPLELVLACEDDEVATLTWNGQSQIGLCAGWDFARKRDRSVIFLGYEVAGLLVVCGVIYLDRMTFAQQEAKGREVAQVVQGCNGTFCMDAGGNGAQIAETLQSEFTCVEAVQFQTAVETGAKNEQGERVKELRKLALARDAKRRFEERRFKIPESMAIRRAIGSIKRTVTPAGNIVIDAARTAAGHGDEFWGLALLNAACSGSGQTYVPASEGGLVGAPVMGGLMGRRF